MRKLDETGAENSAAQYEIEVYEPRSCADLDAIAAHAFPDAAVRELIVPLENLLRAARAAALWVPTLVVVEGEGEDDGDWDLGWASVGGRWCVAAVRVRSHDEEWVLEGPMPFIDVRPGIRVRLRAELVDLLRGIGERLTPATRRAVARGQA